MNNFKLVCTTTVSLIFVSCTPSTSKTSPTDILKKDCIRTGGAADFCDCATRTLENTLSADMLYKVSELIDAGLGDVDGGIDKHFNDEDNKIIDTALEKVNACR